MMHRTVQIADATRSRVAVATYLLAAIVSALGTAALWSLFAVLIAAIDLIPALSFLNFQIVLDSLIGVAIAAVAGLAAGLLLTPLTLRALLARRAGDTTRFRELVSRQRVFASFGFVAAGLLFLLVTCSS